MERLCIEPNNYNNQRKTFELSPTLMHLQYAVGLCSELPTVDMLEEVMTLLNCMMSNLL
jgi:hypothetical protein